MGQETLEPEDPVLDVRSGDADKDLHLLHATNFYGILPEPPCLQDAQALTNGPRTLPVDHTTPLGTPGHPKPQDGHPEPSPEVWEGLQQMVTTRLPFARLTVAMGHRAFVVELGNHLTPYIDTPLDPMNVHQRTLAFRFHLHLLDLF
jgi:hypothetical protein